MNPVITDHKAPITEGNMPNALLHTCPLPVSDYREIVLAHGSGGKLSGQLLEKILLPHSATNCSNHSTMARFSHWAALA
jgi:hydrogenase expression/formation protein HypE